MKSFIKKLKRLGSRNDQTAAKLKFQHNKSTSRLDLS